MRTSREIAKEVYKESQKTESPDAFVEAFINHLVEKKMQYLLPNILKHLENFVEKERELNTPHITFGKEPTKETIPMVSGYIKLKEKNSDLIIDVDDNLIAGFIAEYKGKVYDGSLRGYVKNLKQKLLQI